MDENEFDLRRLVQRADDSTFEVRRPRHNMEQLLRGYQEVPQADWHNLPKSAHIRYLRKDGQFKPGGYIYSIDVRADQSGEHIYLALSWSRTARFPKFCINLDTIDKIWVSKSMQSQDVAHHSDGDCSKRIAALEAQVAQLTDYFNKLMRVIAILENKKKG